MCQRITKSCPIEGSPSRTFVPLRESPWIALSKKIQILVNFSTGKFIETLTLHQHTTHSQGTFYWTSEELEDFEQYLANEPNRFTEFNMADDMPHRQLSVSSDRSKWNGFWVELTITWFILGFVSYCNFKRFWLDPHKDYVCLGLCSTSPASWNSTDGPEILG